MEDVELVYHKHRWITIVLRVLGGHQKKIKFGYGSVLGKFTKFKQRDFRSVERPPLLLDPFSVSKTAGISHALKESRWEGSELSLPSDFFSAIQLY